MRRFLILAAASAAMAAVPAGAQTVRGGGHGGASGSGQGAAQRTDPGGGWSGRQWNGRQWNGRHWGGGRWGGSIDGRWYGGVQAPGGWSAYRRPQRGWAMSGYWLSPAWAIGDWGYYGLPAPPAGYGWSRYYDDAVLIDGDGRVHDSVGGLDWRRGDQPYPSGYGYPSEGYDHAPDAYRGYDPNCYDIGRKRKGAGLGGALAVGAIGAAVGAATGGTGAILLGGGLGALAGQAIDRNSRRDGIVCDDGRAAGGRARHRGGHGPYIHAEPVYGYAPAMVTVTYSVPVTTVVTTTTTTTTEWVYPRKARKAAGTWKPRPAAKSKLRVVKPAAKPTKPRLVK